MQVGVTDRLADVYELKLIILYVTQFITAYSYTSNYCGMI